MQPPCPPPYQTILVSSESTLAGTIVAGNYTRTFDLDGSLEQIRERESGKRNRRYSYMDHQWSLSSPRVQHRLVSLVTRVTAVMVIVSSWPIAPVVDSTFCTLEVGASSTCSTGFDSLPRARDCAVSDTNQALVTLIVCSLIVQLFVESNTGPVTLPEAPRGSLVKRQLRV